MSELNLSHELLENVKNTFSEADPEASDPVVLSQYLAAILGYVIADVTAPEDKLRGLLKQLNEFSIHVFDEEMQKKASFSPPSQDAFGIWRPKS